MQKSARLHATPAPVPPPVPAQERQEQGRYKQVSARAATLSGAASLREEKQRELLVVASIIHATPSCTPMQAEEDDGRPPLKR
jgi:hypothetical protein